MLQGVFQSSVDLAVTGFVSVQMVKATAQTASQNRLDTARAELQEMEKTMEKNLGGEWLSLQ